MMKTLEKQLCIHGLFESRLCEKVHGRDVALLGPAPRPEANVLDQKLVLANVNHFVVPQEIRAGQGVGVFFGNMAVDSRDFFKKEADFIRSISGSVGLVFCPRHDDDFAGKRSDDALETHQFAFGHDIPLEVSDLERTAKRYANLGGYPTTGSLAILTILDHEPRRLHLEGFSWYSNPNSYEKDLSLRQNVSRFANTGHKVEREVVELRKILTPDARVSFDAPTRHALEKMRRKHAIHFLQDCFLAVKSLISRAFGFFSND